MLSAITYHYSHHSSGLLRLMHSNSVVNVQYLQAEWLVLYIHSVQWMQQS